MRYIILNKKITSEEKKSRKDYIEKVTGLYFIPFETEEGVEYKSVPSSAYDCLLIVGHNYIVKKYIVDYYIPESIIIVVSCRLKFNSKLKKSKTIYVSYDREGKTDYYNGKDWNLQFNISKEELKLINSKGLFIDRVKKYFRRINDGKNIRKVG